MGNDAQRRAAFTYNAAADFYDASPLGFWNYFGRRTVERLSLQSGSRVLMLAAELELLRFQLLKSSDLKEKS